MADTVMILGYSVKKTYLFAGAAAAAVGAYLMYTKSGQDVYQNISGRHPAANVLPPEI